MTEDQKSHFADLLHLFSHQIRGEEIQERILDASLLAVDAVVESEERALPQIEAAAHAVDEGNASAQADEPRDQLPTCSWELFSFSRGSSGNVCVGMV